MVESSDITLDCRGDEDALTNYRFHHRVLEFEKEVGRFFSQDAYISRNTASWDWNAVVSGQFRLF